MIAIDVENNILHLSPKDLKVLKTIKPIFFEQLAPNFDLRHVTRFKPDLWVVGAIYKEDYPHRPPEEAPMFIYFIYGDITKGELDQFEIKFFSDELSLNPEYGEPNYIPPKYRMLPIPRRELLLFSTSQSQELGVLGSDFTGQSI